MKKIGLIRILGLSLLLALACRQPRPAEKKFPLTEGWQFSAIEPEYWYEAKIPGTIHTELRRNGLIPDPFYGCNEKDIQWVGVQDWKYRLEFNVPEDWNSWDQAELVFPGLDTYAEVWFNGKKVITADNMFRTWAIRIDTLWKKGLNRIEVQFESALNRFLKDSVEIGYPLPGGQWNTSRKAAYHFGWDWGPRLITCGIWKAPYIRLINGFSIEDVWLRNDSVSESLAQLTFNLELRNVENHNEKFKILLTDLHGGKVLHKDVFHASGWNQVYNTTIRIISPRLWWSNGMGEPYLYHIGLTVSTASGYTHHLQFYHGIRKIQLVQEPDEHGESFFIRLNGVPVYAKGANVIPMHSFVTELTTHDYDQLFNHVLDASMNMLRVWGGGVYQDEYFYQLADRHGIMIWQDFMYACALYPGSARFLENARQEAMEQVRRLRKHPSLALWCGNNEVDEAWHNWGFQKKYHLDKAIQDTIWSHYQKLFHQILPEIVTQYDPERPYISTSPRTGWGRPESMTSGDAHYWGVWWGKEPFEVFLEKIPRFMSELGFQSMPELSLIRKFQPPSADWLYSPFLKCHQKHPEGFEIIEIYLNREKLRPTTLEEYIYHTQLLQAYGIGMAIAAQRSSRPGCMGSLFWQLNDCWPAISWSSIDFEGNRKALHYTVRNLYDTLALALFSRQDTLYCYLLNDLLESVQGDYAINIRYFDGQKETLSRSNNMVEANRAKLLWKQSLKSFPQSKNYLIEAIFTGKNWTRNSVYFPSTLGDLHLPATEISYQYVPISDGYEIVLTSSGFTAFVHLYFEDYPAVFSDNYFHLWAGETRRVICKTKVPENEFSRRFRIQYLNSKPINN